MVDESTLNLTVQVLKATLYTVPLKHDGIPSPCFNLFLMFSSKISPLLHSENVPNLKTPTHFVDPSQFINDDVSTGADGPGKKKKSRENPNSVRDKVE